MSYRYYEKENKITRTCIFSLTIIASSGHLFAKNLPKQSFNQSFIGTWRGKAPIKNLCTGGNQDESGYGDITLEILSPKMRPGQNYVVTLKSNWGCFSKMEIPGFIFDKEFWAATNDRMTFVKLKLNQNNLMSGKFRFDLNGHTLKMDFSNLKK